MSSVQPIRNLTHMIAEIGIEAPDFIVCGIFQSHRTTFPNSSQQWLYDLNDLRTGRLAAGPGELLWLADYLLTLLNIFGKSSPADAPTAHGLIYALRSHLQEVRQSDCMRTCQRPAVPTQPPTYEESEDDRRTDLVCNDLVNDTQSSSDDGVHNSCENNRNDVGGPIELDPNVAPPRPIIQVGGGEDPKIVQLDNGNYSCSICHNEYSRKGVLVRHFVKHRIGGIYCPFNSECGNDRRLFNRWDHFRNHCVANHPGLSMTDPTVRKVYRDYLKRGERIDEGKMKF